jgi:hypothetical protein
MNENLNDLELQVLVWYITKAKFEFATTSDRKWGEDGEVEHGAFYQLMPADIVGMNFFNWYCDEKMYYQFFKSKKDCVLQFLTYWCRWQDENRIDITEIKNLLS